MHMVKGLVTSQFVVVMCVRGSETVTSPDILRKARTLDVYLKYLNCCMLAQFKNKTRMSRPSGRQTCPRINLHPLLYTLSSTCQRPGRQLLIPESQSYLWFLLVALIKEKEGEKILQSQISNWN